MLRWRSLSIWAVVVTVLATATFAVPASGQAPGSERYERDGWLLNLLPRVTDDADVLSSREAIVSQKLKDMGVDPLGPPTAPSFETLLLQHFAEGVGLARYQPPRQVEILETDYARGLVVVYRFPESFLFFAPADTNIAGVAFEAPRPVTDEQVTAEVNHVSGWIRKWGSIAFYDEFGRSVTRRQSQIANDQGLLNFRIPVRLPPVVERIIGRGDATNIRISGRETISISGESTIQDDFIGNEFRQSQSLFPTLDMEQTLQVTLDGTVGEKIKVRVNHDSQALGGQSTQVRLGFEGDEDDIVRTIRAGDIDVTLPGSRLLGVGAQRGGLFGFKVEGAVGPVQYTLLTSKEQSQENRTTFTPTGGTEAERIVEATDYIRDRFFRLTAPQPLFITSPDSLRDGSADWPADWKIDEGSIELFVSRIGNPNDPNVFDNGIAFLDESGRGWEAGNGEPDEVVRPRLEAIKGRAKFRQNWRRLTFGTDWSSLVDGESRVLGIALRSTLLPGEVLACTYAIVDRQGNVVRRVGRSPDATTTSPQIDIGDIPGADDVELVYYWKLLRSDVEETPVNSEGEFTTFALTWEYMFRHFYDLQGNDIDPGSLEVKIEAVGDNSATSDLDTQDGVNLPWIQIFGLDQTGPNGVGDPDGQIDVDDPVIVNLRDGWLQFPDTFTPFNAPDVYPGFSGITGYQLQRNGEPLLIPEMYEKVESGAQPFRNTFDLVIKNSSRSSNFNLPAFNVKEGSERVTLDGAVLTRGTDYDIDYFSGSISLRGDAASRLNAQSNIQVEYEVDPLFGGGRTSLNGMNLTYDLGGASSLSTTWLLQTNPSNNRKPRLGEEPSRNWVGNLAGKFQLKPGLLTGLANLLPRVDTEDESVLNFDGEVAVSIPNPNTRKDAYIEDFEAVDVSVDINMTREGWVQASLPAEYRDETDPNRTFQPEDRAYARWFRPPRGESVLRGDLNPTLSEQERRDVVQTLQVRFETNDEFAGSEARFWQEGEYAGLMRGFAGELDLSEAQFLEFWVNDFTADNEAVREGILHFEFGAINEDFYWPRDSVGGFELGTFDQEDQSPFDGVLRVEEDTGLDGIANDGTDGLGDPTGFVEPQYWPQRPGRSEDPGGDDFDAEEGDLENPFVYINGTEQNQRLDTEDLNRTGAQDLVDGYFSISLDLANPPEAFVDIYRDYDDNPEFLEDARNEESSWRKYRLDVRDAVDRISRGNAGNPDDPYSPRDPDLSKIRFFRIWFENPDGSTRDAVRNFQFSEMRFLGNRWRPNGLRNLDDELATRVGDEDFRVGVLNNKDNPEYIPPVFPDTRNNVAEKEQALQLSYTNLQPGHGFRVFKELPRSAAQDLLVYEQINFFWRAPLRNGLVDPDQADVEAFFWVGSDSLNYYEISLRFDDPGLELDEAGWQECRIDMGELSNLKLSGENTVADALTGEVYRVRIRGTPDLRRIRAYFAGVRHQRFDRFGRARAPITGDVLFNEMRLKEVDRTTGLARSARANLTWAGIGDFSAEWSETDPDFRGLNQKVGSRIRRRDWSVRGSSSLGAFIPTLGWDVPFSATIRRSLQLPDFVTNSDVALLTEEQRQNERTENKSQSYNFQVRRSRPSSNKLFQYFIDPFSYSFSGSRADGVTPTGTSFRESWDQKLNYDLNLSGDLSAKFPLLGRVRLIPNQISMASNVRFDSQVNRIFLDSNSNGVIDSDERLPFGPDGIDDPDNEGDDPRTSRESVTRTMSNTASVTYSPTRTLRAVLSFGEQRDPETRPQDGLFGYNIGKQDAFNQRINLSYKPNLPILKWFEPDLSYVGTYQENRRPQNRREDPDYVPTEEGDPDPNDLNPAEDDKGFIDSREVRHIDNSNDINVRGVLNPSQWLKNIFKRKKAQHRRNPSAAQARRDEGRISSRRGRRPEPEQPQPPAPGEAVQDTTEAVADPNVAPADTTEVEPSPFGESPADTTATEEVPDLFPPAPQEETRSPVGAPVPPTEDPIDLPPQDEEGGEAVDPEGGVDPLAPIKALGKPIVTLLTEIQPIRLNYQLQNSSRYRHVPGRAQWLYRLGIVTDFEFQGKDFPLIRDDVRLQPSLDQTSRNDRVNWSTQSKLSDDIRIDLSMTYSKRTQDGSATAETEDVTFDWPVVSVSVQGVNKWRVFRSIFTNSSLDIAYRESSTERIQRSAGNDISSPQNSWNLAPRWSFTFKNQLNGSLNFQLQNQVQTTGGRDQVNKRFQGSLQLRKNFDAQGFLGFLRFGKEGFGSTIDMTLDVAYSRNRSFREGVANSETGTTQFNVNPSFTYQFSRSLNGTLRLGYRRQSNINRTGGSQSFLLGLNATLSF